VRHSPSFLESCYHIGDSFSDPGIARKEASEVNTHSKATQDPYAHDRACPQLAFAGGGNEDLTTSGQRIPWWRNLRGAR